MKRITPAQWAALFSVGAWGSWRKYGPRGRTAFVSVRCALQFPSFGRVPVPWVEVDRETLAARLTAAGREAFEKRFGAPCPEHGWDACGLGTGFRLSCCAACRAAVLRVRGYMPSHEEPCPRCSAGAEVRP